MMRSARWSLVLGVAGVAALALAGSTDAFARGGGGGGGGGGGSKGKSGATTPKSGTGKKVGGSAGKSKGGASGSTGTAKGRGDFLEALQREEADDERGAFQSDATLEALMSIRSAERGE